MVDYSSIENTIKRLDAEFATQITDPQMPMLLSKLAVMEFCGWLEVSIDEILNTYLNNHVVNQTIIRRFMKKINGFSYENHIYHIFSLVIGVNHWENVLAKVAPQDRDYLESITKSYSEERNRAAHVHTIAGVTTSYRAPSQVLADFFKIKPAIQTIEREVNALR